MTRLSRLLAAGFATAALVVPAAAATISHAIVDGTPVITIAGPAMAGDAKTFAALVASLPPDPKTIVDLSGPGGMVADGMRIGIIIHGLGWTTRVGDGHACYSTCAYTWIAGRRRIMSSDAHVAFHAPYNKHTYLVSDVERKLMAIYAKAVDLNAATVAFIMAKSPGQGFDWLDAGKAKTLDLALEVVPSAKHRDGHFSTGAIDRIDSAEADARQGGGDGVMRDIASCYATYRRERGEDKGFQCFALETAAIVMARNRAKIAHRRVDPRFTTPSAIRRLAGALVATGHTRRGARVLLQRWQADLQATASR